MTPDDWNRVLRDLAVAVARVEEKLDGARSDRAEDRDYLVLLTQRVGKLERGQVWRSGWTAGVAAVVAAIVAPLANILRELWSR
jgi:hypothetical protein